MTAPINKLMDAVDWKPMLSDVNLRDAFYVGPEGGWEYSYTKRQMISWVICGGESGPNARPFNLAWAESLREQCKSASVAFFMKQLGSHPQVHSCRDESCTHPNCGLEDVRQSDRKGGDPAEWPVSLRVREFPQEYA